MRWEDERESSNVEDVRGDRAAGSAAAAASAAADSWASCRCCWALGAAGSWCW